MSEVRFAPEPSSETLRRISADVALSKARGEMALLTSIMRGNRYRREAQSIGVPADCPETHRLVEAAEQDTAALADLERLVSLAMRFMADEQSGRPAPADETTDPRGPSAQGLLARAFAALATARSGAAP